MSSQTDPSHLGVQRAPLQFAQILFLFAITFYFMLFYFILYAHNVFV